MSEANIAAVLDRALSRLDRIEALTSTLCPWRRLDQRGMACCVKLDGSVGECRPDLCPLMKKEGDKDRHDATAAEDR